MTAFQSLGCLLVGSSIPLGIVFLVLRRGWRQFGVADAYQQVARQLGLWADTRGISVHGQLGDRRIWVGEVLVGHGPNRRTETWGLVDLERPLGLGLRVARPGLFRRGRGLPLQEEIARRLTATADDPQLGERLLGADVQAALARLVGTWRDVEVTDDVVRVRLAEPEASPARLRMLVDAMLDLAVRLEAARAELPAPASVVPSLPAWETLAAHLDLRFDPRYPALDAELAGRRVRAIARWTARGWRTDLRLWFRPHEATGLRIFAQRAPDGYWSVGQDVPLGDPDFDGLFVVKAWDPLWVAEALVPEARAALVALRDDTDLEVDDHAVVLRDLPNDPEGLPARLERMVALADALGW